MTWLLTLPSFEFDFPDVDRSAPRWYPIPRQQQQRQLEDWFEPALAAPPLPVDREAGAELRPDRPIVQSAIKALLRRSSTQMLLVSLLKSLNFGKAPQLCLQLSPCRSQRLPLPLQCVDPSSR